MAADTWNVPRIEAMAPDPASVKAARKLLSNRQAFGAVEPTADGRGWWAPCQGMTGDYQVSARLAADGGLESDCTCPSYKRPCKHALALLLHLAAHPEARPDPASAAPARTAGDLDALVRAVFAAPADDLPRLVLADFLEETGDPDRATFIRLSCEHAGASPRSARRRQLARELEAREEAILAGFGDLPAGAEVAFDRGFARLTVGSPGLPRVSALPARFVDLFRRGWVEVLTFDLEPDETQWVYADEPAEVFELPDDLGDIAHLVREVAFGPYLDDDDLHRVAALRPGAPDVRLKVVRVPDDQQADYDRLASATARLGPGRRVGRPIQVHAGLTPDRLAALLASGELAAARDLTLDGPIGDAGAFALASSPDLAGVTHLTFRRAGFGPAGAAALAASRHLAVAYSLTAVDTPLGDAGVAALAAGPGLPQVHRLALNHVGLTAAGAAAALRPWVGRVGTVELAGDPIPPADYLPLAAAIGGVRLAFDAAAVQLDDRTALVVTGGGRPAAGLFDRLADGPFGRAAEAVHVDNLRLTADDIGQLMAGLAGGRLRTLRLAGCGLRNDAVEALAGGLGRLAVRTLDLSNNEVRKGGAEALAASPGLAAVEELDLRGNPIPLSGMSALAASPHRGKLTRVVFRGTGVERAERAAVRTAFGKGVKVEFVAG